MVACLIGRDVIEPVCCLAVIGCLDEQAVGCPVIRLDVASRSAGGRRSVLSAGEVSIVCCCAYFNRRVSA